MPATTIVVVIYIKLKIGLSSFLLSFSKCILELFSGRDAPCGSAPFEFHVERPGAQLDAQLLRGAFPARSIISFRILVLCDCSFASFSLPFSVPPSLPLSSFLGRAGNHGISRVGAVALVKALSVECVASVMRCSLFLSLLSFFFLSLSQTMSRPALARLRR